MTAGMNVLAFLLTIAALFGMQQSTPYYSEILSPVAVPAAAGKPAETERFVFGIATMHLAKKLVVSYFSEPRIYTTSGRWLIIEAAAKAQNETVTLTAAAWRGPSGKRFAMSGRIREAVGILGSERLEPGIPRPVLLVFELPEHEVHGGTLLIAESLVTPLSQQAEMATAAVGPENRHDTVTLARGGRLIPWTLEAGP
jgi:hypothetical protein